MLRQERVENFDEMLILVQQGWQSKIYTALPCIIQSFDANKKTITAQPAIRANVRNQDGTITQISLPILVDVPVFFPSGGGFTLTFPIQPGDECLVVFSSRCIDNWWLLGCPEDSNGNLTTQPQAEQRMHSLSDGIAYVGISSVPNVTPNINTTVPQLRNNAGTSYIEVTETEVNIVTPNTVNITTQVANINASDHVTIDSPQTTVTGTLNVEDLLTYNNGLAGAGGSNGSVITGNIIQSGGIMSSNGIVVDTHVHTGVTSGPDNTGGPI